MVIINGKNYTTVENLLAMKANEAEKTFGLLMTGYNTLGELFSKLGIALTPEELQIAFYVFSSEIECYNSELLQEDEELLQQVSNACDVIDALAIYTGLNDEEINAQYIKGKIIPDEKYYYTPLQILKGKPFIGEKYKYDNFEDISSMTKLTFTINNKVYTIKPLFEIKQEGESKPNNLRIATIIESIIKEYKFINKIDGIPTNITIENNTYIGMLKSFKDFFKLEMKRK